MAQSWALPTWEALVGLAFWRTMCDHGCHSVVRTIPIAFRFAHCLSLYYLTSCVRQEHARAQLLVDDKCDDHIASAASPLI